MELDTSYFRWQFKGDVVGKDAEGNVVEMNQVGRQTQAGNPVARETRALNDIENATGTRPQFHPNNKPKE